MCVKLASDIIQDTQAELTLLVVVAFLANRLYILHQSQTG